MPSCVRSGNGRATSNFSLWYDSEPVLPIKWKNRLSAIIGDCFQNNWHNRFFLKLIETNYSEWF